jgi:chemotaxis protein CheX
MDEKKLQVFIDAVTTYFLQVTKQPAEVGAPYLAEAKRSLAFEMTGIIGISGTRKGCVYFTSPASLLKNVLISIGEKDLSRDLMLDLVGEIANTISGNARKEFGRDFMISVPVVIAGQLENVRLPRDARCFVVPISWHAQRAALVICLE